MKTIKTRLATIAVLLCSIMVKAETVQIDGIWYDLVKKSHSAKVILPADGTKYTGMVNVPSSVTYENVAYNVVSVGENAFENCEDLTSVTISSGITKIESYAFKNCCNLISITIPEGMLSFGFGAFYDCSNLTSISIPESVTSIGDNAFSGCI